MKIAKAIKASGTTLVTHMDTSGMLSVLNGAGAFSRSVWSTNKSTCSPGICAVLHATSRIAYSCSYGLLRNDLTRALHLRQADVIGAISPIAMARIQKVCRFYGGEKLASRVKLIPHPNASYMAYDPKIQKQRLICAIGRWDDKIIKGTDLLCRTSEQLLTRDSRACIEIYGRIPSMVLKWHRALHSDIRKRIILKGVVPNSELQPALQRASISLCTSLQEGYHTVSAEALCCGCSVVGPDVETIPSLKWFTDGPHGQLAPRNPDALTASIIDELDKWDSGLRDPVAISQKWTAQLHAPNIARQIINLARA